MIGIKHRFYSRASLLLSLAKQKSVKAGETKSNSRDENAVIQLGPGNHNVKEDRSHRPEVYASNGEEVSSNRPSTSTICHEVEAETCAVYDIHIYVSNPEKVRKMTAFMGSNGRT